MLNFLNNRINKNLSRNTSNLIMDDYKYNYNLTYLKPEEKSPDEKLIDSLDTISTWGEGSEKLKTSAALTASLESGRAAAAQFTEKSKLFSETQKKVIKIGNSALEKLRSSNAKNEVKLETESLVGAQTKFDEMNRAGLLPLEVLELFPDNKVPSEERLVETMLANPKHLLLLNKIKGAYGDLQNHKGSANN